MWSTQFECWHGVPWKVPIPKGFIKHIPIPESKKPECTCKSYPLNQPRSPRHVSITTHIPHEIYISGDATSPLSFRFVNTKHVSLFSQFSSFLGLVCNPTQV
ncbi:hypothetical protein ACLB2K_057030 [Fragaria x ananassa]